MAAVALLLCALMHLEHRGSRQEAPAPRASAAMLSGPSQWPLKLPHLNLPSSLPSAEDQQ